MSSWTWTLKRGGGLSRAKAVYEVDAARDRATPEEALSGVLGEEADTHCTEEVGACMEAEEEEEHVFDFLIF